MMLVITGSNSLLLSLMSQFGIGSSMQLFAGDLQIIFHTSASVVFPQNSQSGNRWWLCFFQVDFRAVRKVISNVIDLFLEKAWKPICKFFCRAVFRKFWDFLSEEEFIHCLGHHFWILPTINNPLIVIWHFATYKKLVVFGFFFLEDFTMNCQTSSPPQHFSFSFFKFCLMEIIWEPRLLWSYYNRLFLGWCMLIQHIG